MNEKPIDRKNSNIPGNRSATHSRFPLLLLIALPAMLFFCSFGFSEAWGATLELAPILMDANGSASLDPGNTYVLANEYHFSGEFVLNGNGARIELGTGPLRAVDADGKLVLDDCRVYSQGWAAAGASGGALLIIRNNSLISCPGQTGVYVDNATCNVENSTIQDSKWGVNSASGMVDLKGVAIDGCEFGVQLVDSEAHIHDGCTLSYDGMGTGVGVIDGSLAYLNDSTLTGFANAIDVQKAPTYETVEVKNCTFLNNNVSALSVVDAQDVVMSGCVVRGALKDGVYFQNSTGVIEKTVVEEALNTGITLWNCPDSVLVSDTTSRNNAHQGLALVSGTRSAVVINNLFAGNQLAGVLVDADSSGYFQGNLFTDSPDTSIRLHGPQDVYVDSPLVINGSSGQSAIEVRSAAVTRFVLSGVAQNPGGGILAYENSTFGISHSALVNNDDAGANAWSLFANSGASVMVNRASFGPPASRGYYNNAGTASDAANNYWGSSSGPSGYLWNGGGAIVGLTEGSGSSIAFQPFLQTSAAELRYVSNFVVSPGSSSSWNSNIGAEVSLTGAAGGSPLSNETVGVLHVYDTTGLFSELGAPINSAPGGLYVVWVSAPARLASASGRIRFAIPPGVVNPSLMHRREFGEWAQEQTSYNAGSRVLTYEAADPNELNSLFAIMGDVTQATPTPTPVNPKPTPTPTATPTPGSGQEKVENLVYHFYNTVLARDPEAGAVDAWSQGFFNYALSFNIDVRFIPREMGRIFFLSQEYADRGRSDAEFITDCYRTFLRRDPGAAELNGWLSGQWNRAEAMTQFSESAEFAAYIEGLFPGMSGDPTRNFVTTMYIGLLDRLVDEGGLLYWSDLFNQQTSLEAVRSLAKDMARTVVGSDEFVSKAQTNEVRVTRLYRAFLGRFPNTSETEYWVEQLAAGAATMDGLIDLFGNSDEFTQLLTRYFG